MVEQQDQTLPELQKAVTQELIDRYAKVSGDANPIHLDRNFAARGAFGRIVAHGMLGLAFVSEMLTHAFGRSWLESGHLKVRFRAPVYPGETVVTFGRVRRVRTEGGEQHIDCDVGCRKLAGQEVITGEASVKLSQRQGEDGY